jgi:hypothetical protein
MDKVTRVKKMHYDPGWKGFPSEAGMFTRIQAGLREIRASTTMVAK